MHRFFIERQNIREDIVLIKGEDVHHINNVLRLREGEEISMTDGEGLDYIGSIISTDSDEIVVSINDKFRSKGESEIYLKVYQGLPKSDKLELIIQKCTELGVSEIIPIKTSRAVSKIESGKKLEKKINRWQKIAESAAKQSKRGIVPKVDRVLTIKEAILELDGDELKIVFYENEEEDSFKTLLKAFKGKKISLFIGPEGGFSNDEIEEFESAGIRSVSLGNRILRTETVSLTAASIIMYELGDLGWI